MGEMRERLGKIAQYYAPISEYDTSALIKEFMDPYGPEALIECGKLAVILSNCTGEGLKSVQKVMVTVASQEPVPKTLIKGAEYELRRFLIVLKEILTDEERLLWNTGIAKNMRTERFVQYLKPVVME